MGIKKFDGISEDLGINESNYFMYDGWGQCAPPPSELLHLNQVSVGLDRMVSQGCT